VAESNRLITVVLEVTDVGRSAAFYRDVVGLDLHAGSDNDMPGDRWVDGLHVACSCDDGAYMHFALYQAKGEPTSGMQLGFACSDLDAQHALATAADVRVAHAPGKGPWGRTARYFDPDGNVVSLTQS
jgi:predicted enzyme related to lactoylglutathione lyase